MAPNAFAPIALFTFRRPEHTRRALESLAGNPEFERSPLHIFCDGARRPDDAAAVQATRELVRQWPHPDKTLYEAAENQGLATSIIRGVSALCETHGRVIVVEDDLVVAPVFLDFLNRALERYADDVRVMQVSGHMFPVELAASEFDAVFLPFTTSWGWATWQRAWTSFDAEMKGYTRLAGDRQLRRQFDLDNAYPYFSMLRKQRLGRIDSWAVRWYASVFLLKGLTLYPRRSLINNVGFDYSGTHRPHEAAGRPKPLQGSRVQVEVVPVAADANATEGVAEHLRSSRGTLRLAVDWLRRRATQ